MTRPVLVLLLSLPLVLLVTAVSGQEPLTLTLDQAESAGIDGRDWDRCFPGATTFDAAQRSVLLRFPGATEQIAARLRQGLAVAKAEVVLEHAGYEINPSGYTCRTGLGEQRWRENPPKWHVLAWALRRPWHADAESGPTFNAYINGAGYWERYGASDPDQDRFAKPFPPAELSTYQPEARIDVTPALTNASFGADLGQRLRAVEENGFLLRKRETYDMRYRDWWDAYEWAVPTGGHGLTFQNPRLVITFRPAPAPSLTVPAPTDLTALAQRLQATGTGGAPTALLPTPDQLADFARRLAFRQPAWMPEWQWQRVKQLHDLGGGAIRQWETGLMSGDPAQYRRVIADILATPPRYWKGWDIQSDLLLLYLYRDALPDFVQDTIRQYWLAWLMPDLPTSVFFHPQSREHEQYLRETEDWRGRTSFFRDGYCYSMSTMNFNHTAAMGALLGGYFIGSDYAMADGRFGLEQFPLRTWCWYDGSTQESIDHYYFAITLSGQKMFADFGPSQLDRMMGRSILAKSVDELTSSWHPGLRRFISSSGRTTPAHLLVKQDGLCHIMHSLSRGGALHDLDNEDTGGIAVLGSDSPPGRVALQTISGPWAPEFVANMVDEKPLPYEMTVSYKMWGHYGSTPLWRRTYMGQHYGMASLDVSTHNESVPAMIQWRRAAAPVEKMDEISTLLVRYGINTTNFLKTSGGGVGTQGGTTAAFQHRNRMIFLASPLPKLEYPLNKPPAEIRSLQTSIGIIAPQAAPTWELFVDEQPVTALPARVKAGQRITLHDGVSYVGVIPLPASDLGRTEEVVISEGDEQELEGGGRAKISLLIESFNFRQDAPLDQERADWQAVDEAYGGFVLEAADVTEYPTFAAFQEHLKAAQLTTAWQADTKTLQVTYTSGGDQMECEYRPEYAGTWDRDFPTDQCFPVRKVNGQWPYLARGIERDSNLAQQGSTGRLEKNGAVLTSEPARMAFLQTEPLSGTYAAYNPLPDPVLWKLSLPAGVTLKADGRLGMTRVIFSPRENRLQVDYAIKEGQTTPDMATALVVLGLKQAPATTVNDQQVAALKSVTLEGQTAWVVPLVATAPDLTTLPERVRRAEEALAKIGGAAGTPRIYAQDWLVLGPFPNQGHVGFDTVYPPEKQVDLAATYEGIEGAAIAWKRVQPEGAAPLGPNPINLLAQFEPNKPACAYAYTEILADREQEVTIYTGCNERLAMWVNGILVLRQSGYRGDAPDQDRVRVRLKPGANPVLCKLAHGYEGWNFYFRLGDDYGLPLDPSPTVVAPRLPTANGAPPAG